MLEFKKKQHSIYSFVRNETFYNSLHDLYNNMGGNADETVFKTLQKLALSHNMRDYTLFFENLSLSDKFFVLKNEKKIVTLLNESNWRKGTKLFTIVCEKLKKQQNIK